MVATPKQKRMVRQRRLNMDQSKAGEDVDSVAAENGSAEEQAPKQDINLKLLKDDPAFVADCPDVQSRHGVKSFTLQLQGGSGCSIGVILVSGSFYVYKATIPTGFDQILLNKGIKVKVAADAKGGCTIGWRKFENLMQA